MAAFDFDGTLSRGNSGLRFFRFLLGRGGFASLALRHVPTTLRFFLRVGDEAALEVFNREVFAGRMASEVERAAEAFRREVLPEHLIAASMERLSWHVAQGHRCVIVSRAYEVYMRPWALEVGVEDVIATRLTVDAGGRLTGEMPEPSCDSAEKWARLAALLGPREGYELHAYGDGVGDHAMLAAADHAWLRGARGFERWSAVAKTAPVH